MKSKKILITGSQGFIGSHLLRELLPENEIIGLNISKDFKTKNYKPRIKNIVKLKHDDVKESLDGIIHLAALTNVEFCNNFPKKCIETNILGTQKMLELARKKNCKLIFISTSHVYGVPKTLPIKENHSTNPTSVYAKSKRLAEILCEEYSKAYGLNISILRLFSVYGNNSPPHLVTSRIISQLDHKTIQLGNVSSRRDFIFIKDAINAIKIVLKNSRNFGIYNVGTGQSHSILEVCNLIKKLSKKKTPVKSIPNIRRKDDAKDIIADISRIKRLGWKPQTTLENGLKIILQRKN